MNIALWVVQIILAGMFIMAGSMKTFATEKFKASMPWAKDSSYGFVRFIGVVELLGGIGLILPGVLAIAPVLTGISAIGIALIMLFAIIVHAKRKENQATGMNVVLLLIAVFIVVGRLVLEPL